METARMIFAYLPLIVLALSPLTGCAVSSAIEKAETSESVFDGAFYGGKKSSINAALPSVPRHRIFHQGATGFVSVETIRNSALERADSFCAPSGKRPYLIEETTSTPPHALFNWPRIEIIFSCVKSAQPSSTAAPQDKYDRLSKLKVLLDAGAITQQEYEAEKKKVLSE